MNSMYGLQLQFTIYDLQMAYFSEAIPFQPQQVRPSGIKHYDEPVLVLKSGVDSFFAFFV